MELVEEAEVAPYSEYPPPSGEEIVMEGDGGYTGVVREDANLAPPVDRLSLGQVL